MSWTVSLFSILFIFTILSTANAKTLELRPKKLDFSPQKFNQLLQQYNSLNFFDEISADLINWHHKDLIMDSILGISSDNAYLDFTQIHNNYSQKKVIVAVIDTGVDINHEDLQGKIWINKKEIPNNGKDDDYNGYIDDYMGWNFLGHGKGSGIFKTSPTSQQMTYFPGAEEFQAKADTNEIVKHFQYLKRKVETDSLSPLEQEKFESLLTKILAKRKRAKKLLDDYLLDIKIFKAALSTLKKYGLTEDNLSLDFLHKIDVNPQNTFDIQAKEKMIDFSEQEIGLSYLEAQKNIYQTQFSIHYNINSNHRDNIVKDNPLQLCEKNYGNNNIIGPDPTHGTHTAGIIAAQRNNPDSFSKGIAENVLIMPIRAIPNGDERDKDIINAIYYAVDNGAHIINMSFGKYFSAHFQEVQKALLYAQKNNVLIITAAGNDYLDLEQTKSYPSPFIKGKILSNFITVAASTSFADETLIANFSNYGQNTVDILAPGKSIYSTIPGNNYASMSGTSSAAPIVTGSAAVLLALNQNLNPAEIKNLLIAGMSNYSLLIVFKSDVGNTELSNLLLNPGVINLYRSVGLLLEKNNLALNKMASKLYL
ncbi:MAG: S8 family serine peptidase [Halobacteriovoraceae bacterium]|jgi:subtilisin family serine protease|nr:S8 family serine peptidase [Halobacteriovoraceae bacterium]